MKIEQIDENQIRCTLTKEDLVSRHINLSELVYGSKKARDLFKELMEQASFQYGFEAEDVPIMVEAIPLSTESLVLVVTKVENPDELDTRFSRFTETDDDDDFYSVDSPSNPFNNIAADEILNFLTKTVNSEHEKIKKNPEKAALEGLPVDITKMFSFDSLDEIIRLSSMINIFYHGKNSLFKNPDSGIFYLVVSRTDSSAEDYNKVCNILSEFGNQENFVVGTDCYMAEHYKLIAKDTALCSLATI